MSQRTAAGLVSQTQRAEQELRARLHADALAFRPGLRLRLKHEKEAETFPSCRCRFRRNELEASRHYMLARRPLATQFWRFGTDPKHDSQLFR